MRPIWTIFITVFLAELGDKTQLATLLFAADSAVGKINVFLAAAGALVLSTAAAVVAGTALAGIVSPTILQGAAGVGFILIGFWILLHLL